MAGSILYRQAGTVAEAASTLAVTLDHAFANANYTVGVELSYQTSFWITSKTSTGFTLNVGTAGPAYGAAVTFILFHE